MKLTLPFSKKVTKPTKSSTPQYSLTERRSLEYPGVTRGLPGSAYEEMELDPMIQTAITIKQQAVLAADYQIVPQSETPTAIRNAKFIESVFEQMEGSPRTILQSAMDAFVRGWSVQELIYTERDEQIVLTRCQPKDVSQFGLILDEFGQLLGLSFRSPDFEESTVPLGKFAVFINRPHTSRPKGRSDLDSAYPHFKTKQSLAKAWKAHLERYASPTLLGSYQRGLPEDEQRGFLASLKNLHDNTAIVYPDEIKIEALHGRESDNNAFLEAIEFHNREIARSILGQTLTTDEGRRVGSLALGKVHLQVLMLQITSLRKLLADSVMTEQIIRPLIELNFGPGEVPRFEFNSPELEAFTTGKL